MDQFREYSPESWLDSDGFSIYDPVVKPRHHSPTLRRASSSQSWLVNFATASIFGVSLAVTSLPIHAEAGASTLRIAVHEDPAQRDRLGELSADLRSGSVRVAAPDLLQRAEQIANRASTAPVDLNEWAARLIQDVASARD